MQIFHSIFLVDARGDPPPPYTLVSVDDVRRGRWRINPAAAVALGLDPALGQRHLAHYAERLARSGKCDLTIWPYHGMLGGIGHALASLVEEAVFFHAIARVSQPNFHVKGSNALT